MARTSGRDSGSQVSPDLNHAGLQSRENQLVSRINQQLWVRGQGISALSRISSAWRSSMRYWLARWNANSSMLALQSSMQRIYRFPEEVASPVFVARPSPKMPVQRALVLLVTLGSGLR